MPRDPAAADMLLRHASLERRVTRLELRRQAIEAQRRLTR